MASKLAPFGYFWEVPFCCSLDSSIWSYDRAAWCLSNSHVRIEGTCRADVWWGCSCVAPSGWSRTVGGRQRSERSPLSTSTLSSALTTNQFPESHLPTPGQQRSGVNVGISGRSHSAHSRPILWVYSTVPLGGGSLFESRFWFCGSGGPWDHSGARIRGQGLLQVQDQVLPLCKVLLFCSSEREFFLWINLDV